MRKNFALIWCLVIRADRDRARLLPIDGKQNSPLTSRRSSSFSSHNFQILKAFLPGMMEKNHGHIVSLASIAGLIGAYQLTDYCASKFAAGKFTIAATTI